MATKLPTVAIIGQANVGKSSLFNRMVRAQQAIVAREPGTTRDNVIGKVSYHTSGRGFVSADEMQGSGEAHSKTYKNVRRASTGAAHAAARRDDVSEFWLVDTAGLKDPNDEFEATIQEQITEAAEAADVILVVVDSTQYVSDEDRLVAKKALRSKKPVILVVNKTDLKGNLPNDEFKRLGIKTILRASAEHNQGVTDILDEIVAHIPAKAEDVPDDILRIALIGRPNVGKSYLFNTLAGKQQAIVANIAGTTRDINRVALRYGGRDIELLDTAGVRRQGKQEVGIEKFSVLRTLQAIEEADVCFLLMDVNELSTQLDQRLAGIIDEAGKGLALVVSKWDSVEGKTAYTRDALAPTISQAFDFVPWASLIFTSSVTGQNVTKLFDLALDINARRRQELKTRELNDLLQTAVQKHPPAGLKNTHPKLRYIVQTDTCPPWFVIYGANLKFVHWSYKRYLERIVRDAYNFAGTPIKFSFRDEKQIKMNKERAARGLAPVTKKSKAALETAKQKAREKLTDE